MWCVLIISQVTVTTTTTPPLTVVGSEAMLITIMNMLAPTSVGKTTLGQHNVVLLPQLILRDTMRGSVGGLPLCHSSNNLSPWCHLRHMLTMQWVLCRWVSSEFLLIPYGICWHLLWCLLSTFRFPGGCHVHQWGSAIWVYNTTTLQSIPLAGKYASWWWSITPW